MPSILLSSSENRDQAELTSAALAKALVTVHLESEFGVFVAPVGDWFGVYLGRHDGEPLEVTPAVLAAAARTRR